jgi:hypothetical protein
MQRRLTTILLLVIANFILLAHNVIPHHHHKRQVCLVNAHCESEKKAHDHQSNDPLHEHDGSSQKQCSLKQDIVLTPQSLKQLQFSQSDTKKNFTSNHSSSLFFLNRTQGCTVNLTEKFRNPFDHKTHFYTACIARGNGLRAPPIG